MARNVLTLETLVDHATITIDGTAFELINPGELSIVDTHRVAKWGARVQEIYKDLDSQRENEVAELAGLLDKLCRLLWRAPDDIHDRLSDNQRLAIVMAFTELQRGTLPVPAGANQPPAGTAGVLASAQPVTAVAENGTEIPTGGNS